MASELEILQGARDLLAEESRWCQHFSACTDAGQPCGAKSPSATRWCLAGAMCKSGGMGHPGGLLGIIGPSLPEGYDWLSEFNDASTHAEVLALLDRAIAARAAV